MDHSRSYGLWFQEETILATKSFKCLLLGKSQDPFRDLTRDSVRETEISTNLELRQLGGRGFNILGGLSLVFLE